MKLTFILLAVLFICFYVLCVNMEHSVLIFIGIHSAGTSNGCRTQEQQLGNVYPIFSHDYSSDFSTESLEDFKYVPASSDSSDGTDYPQTALVILSSSCGIVAAGTLPKVKRMKRNVGISVKKLLQLRRNQGLEYISRNGIVRAPRKAIPMGICRKKCIENFTHQDQENICSSYWALGDYKKRVSYVAALITNVPKKSQTFGNDGQISKRRDLNHKYHLRRAGYLIEVCKSCFRKTLCESAKFVDNVKRKTK